MAGTLSGTGDYTSTSLANDTTVNARSPFVSATSEQWFIPANTQTGYIFTNSAATQIANAYENITEVHAVLKGCVASNLALADVSRIRTYTANYTNASSCVNFSANFSMTGYMTTFDNAGIDNRYLWITYNDNNFFVEALVKQ